SREVKPAPRPPSLSGRHDEAFRPRLDGEVEAAPGTVAARAVTGEVRAIGHDQGRSVVGARAGVAPPAAPPPPVRSRRLRFAAVHHSPAFMATSASSPTVGGTAAACP